MIFNLNHYISNYLLYNKFIVVFNIISSYIVFKEKLFLRIIANIDIAKVFIYVFFKIIKRPKNEVLII